MADLKLSTAILELVQEDLNTILHEFENADDFSNDVAVATGHDGLGDKVQDFAHQWNDKRSEMVTLITTLVEQVTAINDAFLEADSELAKALEEASAAPAPGQQNTIPV